MLAETCPTCGAQAVDNGDSLHVIVVTFACGCSMAWAIDQATHGSVPLVLTECSTIK